MSIRPKGYGDDSNMVWPVAPAISLITASGSSLTELKVPNSAIGFYKPRNPADEEVAPGLQFSGFLVTIE